ncbi:MAG: hypothetical protein JNK02_09825 [Planctomycetes bacterium]|nr:hypothetical protein [Planctomycetota bacterium]
MVLPAPPSTAARLPWKRLALLLFATAVLRGFLILAPPDDFFENGAVPHEELLRGIAAQELVDGPVAPIQRYQVNNFWGGSLFVSAVAAVPYAVLGPKLVVLRAVALLFGLGCVALLFVLLHRHAGSRAAWIGGSLLAFAPPGYALSSCTLYGTHLEANLIALLLVALVLEEARAVRRGPWTVALGFTAGFALWFGFSLLVPVGVWLVLEFARDRAFLARRRGLVLALAFLVGLAPWIRYQLVHGWSGFQIYHEGLVGHLVQGLERGGAGEKLVVTFARLAPMSACFRDTLPIAGIWAGRVLLLLAGAAAVRAAWISRAELAALVRGAVLGRAGAHPTPAVFALLFLVAFVASYALSRFDVATRDWIFDYRYLMPPVPFACLLAGVAGAELARRTSASRIAVTATVVVVCAACAWSTARQAAPERFHDNLEAPGTSRSQLVRFLARTFGPEPEPAAEVALRILERRDPELARELLAGFGRGIRGLLALPGDLPEDVRRRELCRRTLAVVEEHLPPEAARVFRGE